MIKKVKTKMTDEQTINTKEVFKNLLPDKTPLSVYESIMSEESKTALEIIKNMAGGGVPEDLKDVYNIIFLSGYHRGRTDEQKGGK